MAKIGVNRRPLAAGVIGAVVLAGTAGVAYAATDDRGSGSGPGAASTPAAIAAAAVATASATPAGASSPSARIGSVRRLLRRADQATVEVKVHGTWVTYTVDRGKVSSVSPTAITLALPDGRSITDHITGTTRFRGVPSAASVTVGAGAVTVSQNGTALAVAQRTKAGGAAPTPPTTASTASAA